MKNLINWRAVSRKCVGYPGAIRGEKATKTYKEFQPFVTDLMEAVKKVCKKHENLLKTK